MILPPFSIPWFVSEARVYLSEAPFSVDYWHYLEISDQAGETCQGQKLKLITNKLQL